MVQTPWQNNSIPEKISVQRIEWKSPPRRFFHRYKFPVRSFFLTELRICVKTWSNELCGYNGARFTRFQAAHLCLCAIPRSLVSQQLRNLLFWPSWQSPRFLPDSQMRNTGNWFLKSVSISQGFRRIKGNTWSVDIGFYNNVHPSNTVKLDFLILILAPISHLSHVCAVGVIFLVAYADVRPFISRFPCKHWPSTIIASLGSVDASRSALSDSIQEL